MQSAGASSCVEVGSFDRPLHLAALRGCGVAYLLPLGAVNMSLGSGIACGVLRGGRTPPLAVFIVMHTCSGLCEKRVHAGGRVGTHVWEGEI